jgi:hypothetical protein
MAILFDFTASPAKGVLKNSRQVCHYTTDYSDKHRFETYQSVKISVICGVLFFKSSIATSKQSFNPAQI